MMTARRKRLVVVSILALLLVVTLVAFQLLNGMTSDSYAGQPQVVGLPPGYDPLAAASPYDGLHPSRKGPALLTHTHTPSQSASRDL